MIILTVLSALVLSTVLIILSQKVKTPHDKFIILFAGNLGMAQYLDNVLEAASIIQKKKEDNILFVFLGEGVEKQRLMDKSQEMGLKNVIFLNGVPETEVPEYLGMADVLLSNLGRAPHREAAIPSKIQVYMTSCKPLLVAAEGATVQLVKEAKCGLVVSPDNPEALSNAVLELSNMNVEERHKLGKAAREYAIQHFDLKKQCVFYDQKLKEIVGVN